MSPAHIEQALSLILDVLLDGIDYDEEIASLPAFYARYLATVLADIQAGTCPVGALA